MCVFYTQYSLCLLWNDCQPLHDSHMIERWSFVVQICNIVLTVYMKQSSPQEKEEESTHHS